MNMLTESNLKFVSFFSKDDTNVLKGIAVILMVLHHCFAFYWYSVPVEFSYEGFLWDIASYSKVCVYIFAAITGWVYAHHRTKNFNYSFQKIVTFLLSCLFIVLLLHGIVSLLIEHRPTLIDIRGEFDRVGGEAKLLWHGWYIPYYVLVMLVLPCVAFFENKKHYIVGVATIIIITITFASAVPPIEVVEMLPVPLLGYYAARTNFFERVWERIPKLAPVQILIGLVMLWLSFMIFFELYPWYDRSGFVIISVVPLFFGYKCLSPLLVRIKLDKVFIFLGVHSMNIWFIHSIFHANVSRDIIQNIFYVYYNAPWIFFTTFLTSLLVSILIKPLQDRFVSYLSGIIFGTKLIQIKPKIVKLLPYFTIILVLLLSYKCWYRYGYYLTFKYETETIPTMQVYWAEENHGWNRYKSTRVVTFGKNGEASVFLPAKQLSKVRIDFGDNPGTVRLRDVAIQGRSFLALFQSVDDCKATNVDKLTREKTSLCLESHQEGAYIENVSSITMKASKKRKFCVLRFLFIAFGAFLFVYLLSENQRLKELKD